MRRGVEASPAEGREWGDNDANRTVRKALNKDMEALAEVYAKRSQIIYEKIDRGINQTAWWLSLSRGCGGHAGGVRCLHHLAIDRASARCHHAR